MPPILVQYGGKVPDNVLAYVTATNYAEVASILGQPISYNGVEVGGHWLGELRIGHLQRYIYWLH